VTLIAVAVVLAMVIGVGWALVRFGKRDQEAATIKDAIDEIEVASEVQRETAAMSNTDIARELHDKWTRKS